MKHHILFPTYRELCHNSKREWLICGLLLLSAACSSAHTSGARQRNGLVVAQSPLDDNSVIGTLNHRPISVAQFDPAIQAKLHDVDNTAAQRRLHLLWVGFEEAITQSLLKQEAKNRGTTVDALIDQHVTSKLRPPTETDIASAYKRDPTLVAQVPLAQVSDVIKTQLIEEQRQALRDRFVDSLRTKATIRYDFPIPELPRYTIKNDGSPSRGPSDAAITLVTFTDYQCTYCKRANATLETLRQRYPEQIRIVSRDFPLPQHPDAKRAAEAAYCAKQQDRYWHFHDRLFAHPEDLTRTTLLSHAADLKLRVDDFERCLDSTQAKNAVETSMIEAARYGVSGTPAIFLNGIKLIGVLPLPVMQALIEHELTQADESNDDAS